MIPGPRKESTPPRPESIRRSSTAAPVTSIRHSAAGNSIPTTVQWATALTIPGFYRFRAPASLDNNAFIARFDYHLTADGKHTLFWQSDMQNTQQVPCALPAGIKAGPDGYRSQQRFHGCGTRQLFSPTMVNTLHWGFTTRKAGILGNSNQPWNVFYGLDQGIVYSHSAQTPVHNFLDDFSSTKEGTRFKSGATSASRATRALAMSIPSAWVKEPPTGCLRPVSLTPPPTIRTIH